jgi:2-amino-4-hydroxy-6-hydroxymethyldihydropteridine diphosphokinase
MHPVIEAAGLRGEFPAWAELTDYRRAHVERVAALLARWAGMLGLSADEQIRWRAAGRLHDVLKDAPTPDLRDLVDDDSWPEAVLHAPAAASRLAREGVRDDEFLLAVAYHSVGHPSFGDLGEHLYLADYLEPGRPEVGDLRDLREAMPGGRADVLPRVIRRRIERQLADGQAVLPAAIEFWNRTVGS